MLSYDTLTTCLGIMHGHKSSFKRGLLPLEGVGRKKKVRECAGVVGGRRTARRYWERDRRYLVYQYEGDLLETNRCGG